MKKLLLIWCLVVFHAAQAQEIIYRRDTNQVLSLLSSSVPLQLDPNFCSANAGAVIAEDTLADKYYILNFYYNTPRDILLDTTATVEIRFADESLFTFNRARNDDEITPKDSSVTFYCMVTEKCLRKMTKIPVCALNFITSLYTHRVAIEDKMKLFLPNLARFILDKVEEEQSTIISLGRVTNVPAIQFNPTVNQQLDPKFLGKYSGEWYESNLLYNYDLHLRSDTSYIVWYIINDPAESDPKRIKTQVLNIRPFTEPNVLVMDVCYEADKPDYTDGRRTFYLKLSENGKVLYGETHVFNQPFGKMYGVKKKRYRR